MTGKRKCGIRGLRFYGCKNGDQNTKFFHGSTTQQKRKNFIKGLKDDNGVWYEDEEFFLGLLNDYYSRLFSSLNPHDFYHFLDGVDEVVTDEMRVDLARPYTTKEMDAAIK